jgi:ethanolamine utilization cobalamin adenosyltransferase
MDAFTVALEVVEREDIIQGLNRLSSLIYIMMVQLISGHYRVGC